MLFCANKPTHLPEPILVGTKHICPKCGSITEELNYTEWQSLVDLVKEVIKEDYNKLTHSGRLRVGQAIYNSIPNIFLHKIFCTTAMDKLHATDDYNKALDAIEEAYKDWRMRGGVVNG